MTKVDGNNESLGYGVTGARDGFDITDRGATPGRVRRGEGESSLDNRTGGSPGIAAHFHRGRARVAGNSIEGHIEPVRALYAGHYADCRAGLLQDGTLFDVRFKHGMERPRTRRRGAAIADPLEFFEKGAPGFVFALIGVGQSVRPGNDAGTEHGRRESTAFLIRPARHFDRSARGDSMIAQGSQYLEPRHHAVDSVEPPSRRLCIQVASHQDRRGRRIFAGPGCKQIANLVHRYGAPERARPAREQITAGFVRVGQRLAIAATSGSAANIRQRHQARPQPFAIDPDRRRRGRHGRPLERRGR